ncbi:MAG: hypothetical protein K6G16_10655, partial [Lachnospiraceae bacterium]|nr:hypothetical protein [Lachnospiraceae bacterium]
MAGNNANEERLNPSELFTEDEAFYAQDTRTDAEIAYADDVRRAERRDQSYIPGFFDNDEVLARVERIDEQVMIPGMLKAQAGARLMDDLRTYYLGKGSCTYTTREPVTGPDGKPVFDDNGERVTEEVEHTIPVTTFDEMMDLNNLPMDARRQIVDHYLSDLEAHPIGNSVDEATAEANARYFARIHKAAMERNGQSPWPAADLNAPGAIEDLAGGRSPLGVRAIYAVDFSQNNENLVHSHARDEKKRPNRVRMAYLDEFGGAEEYAKRKDLQDLAQGMKNLTTVITAPQDLGLSFRQRALAKAFIEHYNSVLQEVNRFGVEMYRQGSGLEATAAFAYFFTPGLNLPDAGAPTDEQLRAYLNGEGASPFSEAYIGEVRKGLLEKRVTDAQAEIGNHESLVKEDIDTRMIYNLPYVQMPHKVPNAQGQMVDAPQSLPDLYAMTPEVKHETDMVFDQTLGHLTGFRNYGMQPFYASQLGRHTIDSFRIGGQKASEYMASHGYPQLMQDLDPKAAETAQKAVILTALADPNLEVTFVPLVLGKNGVPVEAAPIRITPATALIIPSTRVTLSIPTALPDDEAAKYYPAMDQYSVNMTAVLACDPGRDVIGMQPDEHLKETIRGESLHTGGKHLDMVPRTIMERLFYDIDGKNGEPPFDDYGFMRNYMGSG